MSLKKRVSKGIALVLIGIIFSLPVSNTVLAAGLEQEESYDMSLDEEVLNTDINSIIENESDLIASYGLSKDQVIQLNEERESFDVDTKLSDMFSDEQVELLKLEFKSTYGDEDLLKKVREENNILTEVNGHRGIIKTTIYDNEGQVKDTVEINYFESLENLNQVGKENNLEIMSRSTTVVPSKQYGSGTVSSVFYPYIKVTRDTKDRISIHGIKSGQKKSYSKEKYNWNSGNTLNFYNSVNNASVHFNKIGYKLSGAVLSKYISYVSGLIAATTFAPALAVVTSALAALGITVSGFDIAKETIAFLYDFGQINKYYHKI
ncbi:hypothetical protein [Romboutsia sp. 1001713B170207_170306_H8]|uniref:hypothetical protein n=1 Tax=Romboutsia sp. 1001713B170207_170306_H8 TaxID=2787112 RepID=UPI00189B4EEB|nr:hypothetical protein [Romboutsia sp. 1001713B170207_170306_H8]